MQFILHLICWISGFALVYGITALFAVEEMSDFVQILLVMVLAFISCYQSIKGNLNGTNSQRQAKDDLKPAESPPM